MDVDRIWHQYITTADRQGARTVNHIMLIEEKPHNSCCTFAQRDTMMLLNQALRIADDSGKPLETARGDKVRVRFWGYFTVRYSGEDIGCAEHILWDDKPISLDVLEQLLRFEIHPRTFRRRSDRRHHVHGPLPLFGKP